MRRIFPIVFYHLSRIPIDTSDPSHYRADAGKPVDYTLRSARMRTSKIEDKFKALAGRERASAGSRNSLRISVLIRVVIAEIRFCRGC